MIACPKCSNQSPDGSLHCVHCGHRFGEEDHQATRMGMPVLHPAGGPMPASERGGGARTAQFGAEDLARLAAAAAEHDPAEQQAAADDDAARRPSLLAGLPRPRVSSTPSPLTGGLKPPAARTPRKQTEAPPSARRTVMGMPVMLPAAPTPNPNPAPAVEPAPAPAPVSSSDVDGPAILPLDSFQPEATPAEAPAPVVEVRRNAPEPAPSATDAASEPAPVAKAAPRPEPSPPPSRPAPAPAVVTAPPPDATEEKRGIPRAVLVAVGVAVVGAVVWVVGNGRFW